MTVRNYSGNATPSTLIVGIGVSDVTFTVADASTWPTSNFVLTLDAGGAEEKVFVGSRTGNTLSTVTRAYDGTTAVPHSSGATVRHTIAAVDLAESNAHANNTALHLSPVAIPFHVSYGITAGLKVPKFIAPAALSLLYARAVLEAGSGVTYRVYVNGAALAGLPISAAVGTSVVFTDFVDHSISAGDTVQVFIVSAGTSASDLSVTVGALYL